MNGVQKQARWLIGAMLLGAGLAVVGTLLVVLNLRQAELSEVAAAKETEAEANAAAARDAANQALRAREQAEELVQFFLEELHAELAPIGRIEVYEIAAERALRYFESLPPELVTPETEASRAFVFAALAQARYERGDLSRAILVQGDAVAIRRALAGEGMGTPAHLELATDLNELAILQAANGDTAAARANFLGALEAVGPEEGPSTAQADRCRASAYFGLAEIERYGENPEAALRDYNRALSFVNGALEQEPDSLPALQTRMVIQNNAGLVRTSIGDWEGAEADLLQSVATAKVLMQSDPDDPRWKKELATNLNNLGTLLDEAEDHERAEPLLREALQMREALVAWDPRNGQWRADLANSWHNLAMLS